MDEFGDAMWMGHLVGDSLQIGCFVDGRRNYRMLRGQDALLKRFCSWITVGDSLQMGCFVDGIRHYRMFYGQNALLGDGLWLRRSTRMLCSLHSVGGCFLLEALRKDTLWLRRSAWMLCG